MLDIGVMQGRLTPSRGRGIQFYLSERTEWEKEFNSVVSAGVSFIEWVGDARTPLFGKETQEAVRIIMKKTGVRVRNMDLHELLTKNDIALQPDELFEKICSSMKAIEGGAIEAPLVEASSLLVEENYPQRVEALKRLIAIAEKHSVLVAVETDLPPQELKALLEEVPEASVVYDCGNSTGFGYDMKEEVVSYGSRITNVHIKDKLFGGTTVPLGEGSVNFQDLFALLKGISYTGPVTLQAARGEDGREVETIREYVSFIHNAYEKSI